MFWGPGTRWALTKRNRRTNEPALDASKFAIALPPRTGLVLPSSAVLLEGDGAYVYIARSATTFHRQVVRVESVAPDRVMVLEGVAAGDSVVAQGAQILEAERLKRSFTPVEED